MIGDFRIMPRATYRDESHTRYGFFIKDHPKGDPTMGGLYFCSWEDWDMAVAGAFCLGVDPHQIQSSGYIIASDVRSEL